MARYFTTSKKLEEKKISRDTAGGKQSRYWRGPRHHVGFDDNETTPTKNKKKKRCQLHLRCHRWTNDPALSGSWFQISSFKLKMLISPRMRAGDGALDASLHRLIREHGAALLSVGVALLIKTVIRLTSFQDVVRMLRSCSDSEPSVSQGFYKILNPCTAVSGLSSTFRLNKLERVGLLLVIIV